MYRKPSPEMPSLAQSVTTPVPTEMASQYTNAMTTMKMGRPKTRFVTTRSIFCVRERPFADFFTVSATTSPMAS